MNNGSGNSVGLMCLFRKGKGLGAFAAGSLGHRNVRTESMWMFLCTWESIENIVLGCHFLYDRSLLQQEEHV